MVYGSQIYYYYAVWGHALHKHSHMFKVFMCVPKYTSAAISVLSVLVQRVCSSSVHDSFDLKDVHSHWYTDTLFLIPVLNAHTHTHTRTHAFMFVCPKIDIISFAIIIKALLYSYLLLYVLGFPYK